MQQQELKEALDVVLSSNFDAVTKSCFFTCIKLLDNFIQTPTNPVFWSINLSNKAVQSKILNVKGGQQVLLGCGFVELSSSNNHRLILPLDKNDTDEEARRTILERCITARKLLATCCVEELHCSPDDLPKYNPPPPPQVPLTHEQPVSTIPHFNPYQPHRFDALSAAVGHKLGPDGANYRSKTEAEVERLERQRQQLLAKTKQKGPMHRQWQAYRPGEITTTTTTPIVEDTTSTAGATLAGQPSSDMSLLAGKVMMQSNNNKEQGFTTSAMRKLQKLQHAKVYDYTILKLIFPNGTALQGHFYPDETIATVQQVIATDCLVDATALFDLCNVAPPRTVLSNTTVTLEEAQLVPAAKVTIRWKDSQHTSTIRPELFHPTSSTSTTGMSSTTTTAAAPSTIVFPIGNSVVASMSSTTTTTTGMTAGGEHPVAADREEELMRRMMGGKKAMMRGGASTSSSTSTNQKQQQSDKPSTATPKWFQKK